MNSPPSIDELKILSTKLGLAPKDFIRTREADFKDNNLSDHLENSQHLFENMSKFPKLLERPIVVKGDKAVLGRPPEKVREFLG